MAIKNDHISIYNLLVMSLTLKFVYKYVLFVSNLVLK